VIRLPQPGLAKSRLTTTSELAVRLCLEAVVGRQAAVGVAGAFVGWTGRVSREHCSGFPVGEAHEGHPRSHRWPASHGRTCGVASGGAGRGVRLSYSNP
jgi:hypothetical protein